MELEKKLANIKDITDSEACNIIIIHLEQLQEEDEEFMEILLSKSNDMTITWKQPWYQQSKTLTRVLKEENHKEESYRTDTFSYDERKKIRKNWRRFRKLFDIPDKPICLARWKNTDKSKNHLICPEENVRRLVAAFLAQGLQRTVQQVFRYFIIQYGHPAKGFYTMFEDTVINICLYHLPNNAVPIIAYLLGREPRGIYKRIQKIYSDKEEIRKTKHGKLMWTLPLATKFINLLIKYTGEPIGNLKYRQIDNSVWLKIQDDMGYDSACWYRFWYKNLHVQIFVKYDVKIKKLRRKIFKLLRNYSYKYWSDIRWKELLKHFADGFTHGFLYKVSSPLARKMENYHTAPLEDVIVYALQKNTKTRSKRLRTLILNENNELELVRYNNKNYYIHDK